MLDTKSLQKIYFSFIHSYLNYANIVWGSTHRTNLKKLNSQQKHAIRIVYNKDNLYHTRELFEKSKTLNIFKLNIFNNVLFMHRVHYKYAPTVFRSKFRTPSHQYPTKFAESNYTIPKFTLKKCKFRISIRGPFLWNNILTSVEKQQESAAQFRALVKSKLLLMENEIIYF